MTLWRQIVVSVIASLMAGVCGAQNYNYYSFSGDDMIRRSVEMGVAVGANYMNLSSSNPAVELSPKMGMRAALQFSLQWDRAYALQMEVGYLYNKIDASLGQRKSQIKSNLVEVPVMFSYRGLRPMRFGAGVVLTPLAAGRYDTEYERLEAGQMRSLVGYVAQVGVSLTQHLLIDARFTGSLGKTSNYFEGVEYAMRGWWLSVGIGYMF
ncbi:MAG: PorT family protein [Alistipes sp.]|nr:PorT family protein [Alistipes sp.]